MGNSFFNSIGSYFKTIGLSLIGQLKASVASFLNDFIKDDIGALAGDAVAYAQTLIDKSGDDKKAAAKVKLVADLTAAGHDAAVFGESVLNFLIETAYQALLAEAGQGIIAIKG